MTRVTPVHALSARGFASEVLTVTHDLRAEYDWAAGEAIGGFLAGLRRGELLGRQCRSCQRVLLPPRMFCERCFRPTDGWVTLPSTGKVITFSVCHVAWDLAPLSTPIIPAVIEVDGATGMLQLLGGIEPPDVVPGLRVRAVWKPEAEREGSILDIAHWVPETPA